MYKPDFSSTEYFCGAKAQIGPRLRSYWGP